MGPKAVETLTAIHLAQELLRNTQCNGGSRSFAKEMRPLKMRRIVASHQKLAMTNREQSSKLILLQLQVRKLDKWVPHELTTIKKKKKIVVLKCNLILSNNNESFLDWIVTYNEKWILYNNC